MKKAGSKKIDAAERAITTQALKEYSEATGDDHERVHRP